MRAVALAAALLAAPARAEGPEVSAPPPAAPRLPVPPGADATPEPPAALLARAFSNLYGDDYVQVMALETRRRSGRPMTRRVQLTRKQGERPGKALVRFLDPPEVRRSSVLILDNGARDDDFFVFLPVLGKVRRFSGAQRADSFFGTDLWYEDIEPKDAADFEVALVGASEESGAPCRVLDVRPRPGVESAYDRMVTCIEPRRGVVLRTDFHRRGRLVKHLRVDPGEVHEVGGRHVAFSFVLETPRLRSETRVRTETYEVRADLPDAIFTTSNLEAGDAEGDRRGRESE
jgi:hypothetical protein